MTFQGSTFSNTSDAPMRLAANISLMAALVFSGAIFGFFYAWVCSTMWGLDQSDPRVAIIAMQDMNTSVRNGVFAPAFFGTPVVLAISAVLALFAGCRRTSVWVGLGAVLYGVGGMLLTMLVNVPMNQALGALDITLDTDVARAREIWVAYSTDWKVWNAVRTVFSGLALLSVGVGLLARGNG